MAELNKISIKLSLSKSLSQIKSDKVVSKIKGKKFKSWRRWDSNPCPMGSLTSLLPLDHRGWMRKDDYFTLLNLT